MPRITYTAEQRQAALALYVEHGAKHTAEQTGIKASTIRGWATRAGAVARCNENRQANVSATRLTAEQHRHRLADRLRVLTDEAVAVTLQRLHDPDNKLSEVVGAWTRGIHDLALLTGGATERTEQVGSVDAEIQRLLERMPDQTPQHQEVPV